MAVKKVTKNLYDYTNDQGYRVVGSAPKSAEDVKSSTIDNVVKSMTPTPYPGSLSGGNTSVMGNPYIYPGSLHGNTPNTPQVLTNVGSPTGTDTNNPLTGSARYQSLLQSYENAARPGYTPSDRVKSYQSKLDDWEDAEKPTWQSKYEPAIQSILDGILNRKSFNLNEDANYQTLYDQYAQSYRAQGDRAMRDQLGASAGLTGGYGSTAAQAAASQAYDNYMQGLNNQNMQLMQLAYQMYGDETADRYNQLGAVTGLDNTDYARYRDDVSDFYNERDYWANRYNQEFSNDYGQYRDIVSDYLSDRDYYASQYASERGFESQAEQDEYNKYQDAVKIAMQYASQGLGVPSYIAKQIQDYTGAADISDVVAAMPVSTGGSGGSSGGSRGRSSSSGGTDKQKTSRVTSYPIVASDTYNTEMNNGSYSQITNRNGEGWVYVAGIGRLTYEELENAVNRGDVIEKKRKKDGADIYTYTKS